MINVATLVSKLRRNQKRPLFYFTGNRTFGPIVICASPEFGLAG